MANFKIRLPHKIDLQGKWKVALSEIHYTNSLITFDRAQRVLIKSAVRGTPYFWVPASLYESVSDLVQVIAKLIKNNFRLSNPPQITLSSDGRVIVTDGKVTVRGEESPVVLEFSPTLKNILGLDRFGRAYLNARRTNLYVYTDLVTPCTVGDVSVPLLRHVDGGSRGFGANISHVFKRPYFRSLAKTSFEDLEIQLLDDSGKFPNFKYGNVSIVLEFKKHG